MVETASRPSPSDSSPGHAPEDAARLSVWRRSGMSESTAAASLAAELAAAIADPGAHIWLDLIGARPELVAQVSEVLGLHPLVAEDIVERDQRAKVELIDDALHIVVFALTFSDEAHASEIDIVLGPRFLMTSHDTGWDPNGLPSLRRGAGLVLAKGADFLLWAILDSIVDGYFPVLDTIGDEIDKVQDDVIDSATTPTLQRIFTIKRELIELRRAISPAREILNQLTNRQLSAIKPGHVVYFRDVYDHLIRVTDELDNDRDLIAATLDVYLSTVNNNLSMIMKRLTGVTVILAGVGAVAGMFGMSEAGAVFAGAEGSGFWLVSSLTFVAAIVAVVVLRRIDWI